MWEARFDFRYRFNNLPGATRGRFGREVSLPLLGVDRRVELAPDHGTLADLHALLKSRTERYPPRPRRSSAGSPR